MKKILLCLVIITALLSQSVKSNVCDLIKGQTGTIVSEIESQSVSLPVIGNTNIGTLLRRANVNLNPILESIIDKACPRISSELSTLLISKQGQICNLAKTQGLPRLQQAIAQDPQLSELAPLIAPFLSNFIDNQCPSIIQEVSQQLVQ